MSLRYASRVIYQAGVRAAQAIKDQSSTLHLKSLKDTAAAASSSSKQARKLSTPFDSRSALKAATEGDEKRRMAEESLRMVMYLSCWGPN